MRVGRHHEGGLGAIVPGQPASRLPPVGGHLGERPRLQRLAVQVGQAQAGQDARRGDAAGQAADGPRPHGAGQHMRDPQRKHRGQHRLDLVDVSQRRQRPVQQCLYRLVQRPAERPPVAGQRA